MKHVKIYTDGACSGNPGPGGWGAILKYNDKIKEICGSQGQTTNNRMELTAAIEGLSALTESCDVTLYSDSKYLVDAINNGWVFNWEKKNWMKNRTEQVPNSDLWKKLIKLLKEHKVEFEWVRGHNGHPENERCDKLATKAIGSNTKFNQI
ncbi:MAG: ribonuclease HI [Clostridiaceae bacterium]|nr:ribonuclease HI [Clostridiaceae bacterium]